MNVSSVLHHADGGWLNLQSENEFLISKPPSRIIIFFLTLDGPKFFPLFSFTLVPYVSNGWRFMQHVLCNCSKHVVFDAKSYLTAEYFRRIKVAYSLYGVCVRGDGLQRQCQGLPAQRGL